MGILIQGGRIVDAATDTDKKGDIYLEDGVITEIGEKLKIKDKSDKVIDAKGCFQRSNLQESKAISKDKQERIVLAPEAEQIRMQYIDR